MARTVSAIALTLLIMHLGAFVTYGAASALFDLPIPEGVTPAQMFGSVLLQKLGLSIAFVLLYQLALDSWRGRWVLYGGVWFVMFAIMEIGQAIGPAYSSLEAIAGIGAEAIYCPLSAYCVQKIYKNTKRDT